MPAAILITPRADGQWSWAAPGEPAVTGSLQDLGAWFGDQARTAGVTLLVPGEDVLLATVSMPTRNPARIERALPFALEDHLLGDPAGMHCVAGPWADRDNLGCAAVERSRLQGWLDELASQDIQPVRAYPDTLCLPWEPDSIRVMAAGPRALVRWGECAAAACDTGSLKAVLSGIRAATGLAEEDLEGLELRDENEWLSECAAQSEVPSLNLLQGEFLPAQRRTGWHSWRLPAALAAGVFLASVLLGGMQLRVLDRQSDTLSAAIDEQFRSAFPHINRVQSDPGPQVELELRRLRLQSGATDDRFLALLGRAAPALAASPGLRLERLQYRDGQLELGVTAGQIADLDALRMRLQAAGVAASQGVARMDNDQVSGSITLSPGPGGAGR